MLEEENSRKRSRKQQEEEPFSWKKEIISWIQIIVAAVIIALVLNNFIIANSRVPTGSMENTIMSKSRVIGSRLSYLTSDPERGDVVIFHFPDDPTGKIYYVKRVIGLPGETVSVVDGKVYINDSDTPLDEPYLPEPMEGSYGPYTVPEGCYFMMGDNRNNSLDARFWKNQFVEKDQDYSQGAVYVFSKDRESGIRENGVRDRMKIIISPAKKMNIREDELEWANLPCFLSRAEELKRYIQGLDLDQARKLWQCNEKIALLNYGRFKEMDLERRLTPALLSYEGIQYQYMAPGVFEQGQWDYVQEHLRILSGFYGILKPLDGIVPYRLEMQAKVELPSGIKSLYDYWGSSICRELAADETLIVNLASKEYSRAVEPYLEAHIDYVTCVFGTLAEDGTGGLKVKVKATEAKMARGEMVRFMAERGVRDAEGLKGFDRLGYRYCQEKSGDKEYVFIKIREQ